MKSIRTASLAFAVAASAFATQVSAGDKLPVVASFSILGDVVGQVGGDRVAVITIVAPGGDAHVYQPTPADAGAISKAAVVFVNGLGFEGWIDRLIKSSGYKGPVIAATAGLKALKGDGHGDGHGHHDHGHAHQHGKKHEHQHGKNNEKPKGHGHDHGDHDPHAWQNVKNVITYVANVKDALCKADAAGCETFTQNAAAYTDKLKALDAEIRKKLGAVTADKRKVITSHDAFAYFADAYGVSFLAPIGVSTESEASAKDVAALIDQIRKQGVRAVFVENISDTRLIEQIARETGATIGGTLYSDALSKADGPAATYIDMMLHNAVLMAGAMAGS